MSKTKNKKLLSSLTLSRKITLLYGSIFSIAVIVLSVFLFKNAASIGRTVAEDDLKTAEKAITEVIHQSGFEGLKDDNFKKFMPENVSAFIVNRRTEEILVLNKDNTPDFNKVPKTDSKSKAFIEKLPFPPDNNFTIHEFNGSEYIISKKTVFIKDNEYSISMGKKIFNTAAYTHRLQVTLLFIDFICILLSFLIGKYISKMMLNPVRKITETAESISVYDLSKRIDISGPDDEMKELSMTFNSMIERLEESFEKQNRFVSDASHELRTPISVIQGYAKLIDRWGKSDPKVLQESIDSIISETDHMASLTKKLLFLAKSDQSLIEVHKEKFLLNKLVEETAKEVEITDCKRKIKTEKSQNIELYGDEGLIKQLLWIFTENAIKYTSPENGLITYKVYEEDDYICLSVKDNGIGISEENSKHIFDRFYRVDESRNKAKGGTGLGLSIAKWIASVHNADITVISSEEEGSEFVVQFKK